MSTDHAEVLDHAPDALENANDWGAALAEQGEPSSGPLAQQGSGTRAQAQVFEQLVHQGAAPGMQGTTMAAAGFGGATAPVNDINMILDIPVQLTVELGRTRIPIKQILQLAQGSVIELDGLAGEPMDVLINGCLIAQGEVVVVNEKFGIRLTDVITPSERIRKLNR